MPLSQQDARTRVMRVETQVVDRETDRIVMLLDGFVPLPVGTTIEVSSELVTTEWDVARNVEVTVDRLVLAASNGVATLSIEVHLPSTWWVD